MEKILLVYKKSTYELMQADEETTATYLDTFPKRKAELLRSHTANTETLAFVESYLQTNKILYQKCYRAKICDVTLKGITLIISVGGDGTLLDIAKYVTDTPILGVNSDPTTSTGFFCHTNRDTFVSVFENLDSFPTSTLPRMKLSIDDKPFEFPVLNDVFVSHKNHADMIRVAGVIDDDAKNELFFRSSGLLISTTNGSTAWMYNEGGEIMKSSDTRLQFRESGARNKKAGFATKKIELVSHMYAGILAIDGSHQIVPFSFGSKIVLQPGAKSLTIYGDVEEKKRVLQSQSK